MRNRDLPCIRNDRHRTVDYRWTNTSQQQRLVNVSQNRQSSKRKFHRMTSFPTLQSSHHGQPFGHRSVCSDAPLQQPVSQVLALLHCQCRQPAHQSI